MLFFCLPNVIFCVLRAFNNSYTANHDTGLDLQHQSDENSNTFSTTWSFQTSEDPWTAGASSDVFVVPNLFVAVEEVYEVFWDEAECEAAGVTDGDGTFSFPSQLVFDINSPPSEQSLAFYSRYHVEYVKIPELKYARDKQVELVIAMERKDPVCCSVPKVNSVCPPDKRNAECDQNAIDEEIGDRDALIDGVQSWEDNVKKEADRGQLVNWMSEFGSEGMHGGVLALNEDNNDELMTPVVSAGLIPQDLINAAIPLPNKNLGEDFNTDVDALRNAKRLQISGGGTKYEMTLKKVREGTTRLRFI